MFPKLREVTPNFSPRNHGFLKKVILMTIAIASLSLLTAITSFSQIVLPVTDDAFVYNQSQNTNFGTNPALALKNLTGPNRQQFVYLKFNTSLLPSGTSANDIGGAILKVYVNTNASAINSSSYFYTACANWNEATITYTNQPNACTFLSAILNSAFVAGQYVSIDVTQAVKSW